MTRFTLWFEGVDTPELFRTEFFHSLTGETLRCVRGKTSGPYKNYGTFQWTNAVKALSVLCLKARCFQCEAGIVSGGKGSLAASLDYAIDKQPNWLIDMVGLDAHGQALVSRLITRSNPGQRKGRKVCLAVNGQFIASDNIKVFVDGVELDTEIDIHRLLKNLSCHCKSLNSHMSSCDSVPSKVLEHDVLSLLKAEYLKEVESSLKEDAVFSTCQWKSQLKKVLSSDGMKWVAGSSLGYLSSMLPSTESEIFGVLRPCDDEKKFLENKFTVCCSPILASSLSIFTSLHRSKKLKLALRTEFSQTVSLISTIEEEQSAPDLFVASMASAARFSTLSVSEEYVPLMIMPSFSHAVITSKNAKNRSRHQSYHFSCDHPATPHFVYRELQEMDIVRKGDVFSHLETRLLSDRLRDDDEGIVAIRSFPYYNANLMFDNCECITDRRLPRFKQSVLFGRRELFLNEVRIRLFRSLIYDAWNTLRVNEAERERVLSEMFSSEFFQKSLMRFTGVDDVILSGVQKVVNQ